MNDILIYSIVGISIIIIVIIVVVIFILDSDEVTPTPSPILFEYGCVGKWVDNDDCEFCTTTCTKGEYGESPCVKIKEYNVGHFIIGESIKYGLRNVIKKFKKILNKK